MSGIAKKSSLFEDDGTTPLIILTTPPAHKTSHENGGSDEISVTGLSGLLADSQTPLSHTHAESEVTGLVSDLAAKQDDIQFKDDGTNRGASGAVTTVDFTGAGVSASEASGVLTVNVPGGAGEAFPVGAVFISVVSTNPNTLLGYGTWSAIAAGRVLVGLDSGDANFDAVEETGGAKTVASAGSVAAPTLSGSVANEVGHVHSVTSNVTVDNHASHTHAYTEVPNHVHGVSTILRTATTGADTTQVTNAQDTSSTKDTTRKTDNPDSGVASGTTQGPSATLTHTVTNNAVSSAVGTAHNHAVGSLAASAPAFTGSATSVVQPYFVVYMWKRTA